VWKQNADNTWSEVHAAADVKSAEASLNNAARSRTAYIQGVYIPPSTTGRGASTFGLAKGGLSGYAGGGQTKSKGLPGYASGSLVDATKGGLLSGPGTPTSDDIFTLFSNGLGKTSDEEFVIKAKQTKKWYPLLVAINEGMGGFADGGPVKYGSVSQSAWDSLLAQGWRGNPKDGMEALYPPGGMRVDLPPSVVAAKAPAALAAVGAAKAVASSEPATAGAIATAVRRAVQSDSGRTANITINVNGVQQPDQMLAAQVANEVAWRLK
jgi:hypothetical protein